MCAWRRSLKIYGQVSKVMNEITKDTNYRFVFLTLTLKNCSGEELTKTIDCMLQGYSKLLRKTKNVILGSFRSLEITHNVNKHSKSFNTYHPHIHAILLVKKSYFLCKNIISQKSWCEMWQNAIGINYQPIVYVETIKQDSNITKAVAEVAKYSVKSSDFLNPDSQLQDDAIYFLDTALAHRRLIAFSGILKDIHKRLNLDDAIDGDLLNTDSSEELREDLDYIIERYHWHIGYKQYLRLDDDNEFKNEKN
jgi:plasmid rolling circle replication initiator protein Rep